MSNPTATPVPTIYMNKNNRSLHFAKPQHVENPDMIPYFGEMPKIHPKLGFPVAPKEELGPAFAMVTDEAIRPEINEDKKGEKTPEDVIPKIAAAIKDLKPFDFTAAGLPKVDILSTALGFPVTAQERDGAHTLYLELKKLED